MRMLLDGEEPALQILARQFACSKVKTREFSGAGFFTTFKIPSQAPRLAGNKSFDFGDVVAECEGLQHGAGFVLHVRDGAIDYLEGYSYDEPWMAESGWFRVAYTMGGSKICAACGSYCNNPRGGQISGGLQEVSPGVRRRGPPP